MQRQLLAYGELFCFLAAWTLGITLALSGRSGDLRTDSTRSASAEIQSHDHDFWFE